MKGTILVNEEVVPNVHRLVLEAPLISKKAKPGQFVIISINNEADPAIVKFYFMSGREAVQEEREIPPQIPVPEEKVPEKRVQKPCHRLFQKSIP